ncbi:Mov34/MPN/PAD-1 family protein [Cytobacillus pseudoceanisediminis]|uniref:Mov34/MPN/PAD-1 family protein n=1 Tax=Cytobacillus pseudoceanisediminis TaxID=3051614 RepID=UPI00365F6090
MKIVRFAQMKEGIHINNEIIYLLPNGKTLFIRPECIDKMQKYRQVKRNDTEAGGILIGRILIENGHYIIDEVSEPMTTDKRRRTYFKRNMEGHQEFFNSIWDREVGSCFYLGEWHTHPENNPTPSSIDWKNWNRLKRIGFESECLFFIIVGINEMKVWYSEKNSKIIELRRRSSFG